VSAGRNLWAGRLRALALALGAMLVIGAVCDWFLPPNHTRFQNPSPIALDRNGEPLRVFLSSDGAWRLPVDVEDIDRLYLDMLVAYEDQQFHRHPGVDPLAMARALLQWARAGDVVSGASTITMQAARLLEPRPRSFGAKLIEMARALQLEMRHAKPEILAIYLTLAPFGGNLEGVRAASLAYFGKEPRRLTEAEAALLVALPQSPERLRPDRDAAAAKRARDHVLDIAAARGVIDNRAAEAAKQAPIPQVRHALPFLAPHLTEHLIQHRDAAQSTVETTIDGGLQAALEDLLTRRAGKFDAQVGLSAIVVDHATMEVRAYVGAPDYFDEERHGMINMASAIRSPGSALKPFIYGIGFDRLLLHPDTVMSDTPLGFDGYIPSNFDGGYRGDVTAREALQQSLNIPAVALLDRIGPLRFDAALRQAGIMLRFDRSMGGASLPLALGGVGVTLEELTTLYAALSNGGQVRPLVFTRSQTPADPAALFGAAAAWYVKEALKGVPTPPGLPDRFDGARAVGFKTGTSYGYRDAWAIGFSGSSTIGVWVGRPDGTPCDACVGIEAAAPILFQIVDLLPTSAPTRSAPPAGLLRGPTSELPAGLRRFDDATATATERDPNALSIIFPADGSRLMVKRAEDGLSPVALRADGGVGPLTWFINGEPLAEATERWNGEWTPDGIGFVGIEAVDAQGGSAMAEVFIGVAETH
jgi:penicillin-binding protein 1C